jgi:branched-chain amino acid aminotransferase
MTASSKELPKYLLYDGELVPYQDARVHVLAPALKYGVGVFEGFRGYWSETDEQLYAFRVRDHLRRLAASIEIAGIEVPGDVASFESDLLGLIRANDLRENIHMRIQVLVVSEDGAPGDPGPSLVCMAAIPMGAYFGNPRLHMCVSSWARISDRSMPPRVKSIANYHNGRLAVLEARRNGYDAPLLLTPEGRLSEGFGYNIFVLRNGRLATPSVTDGILEGITRDSVLRLAREELGIEVDERPIDRTELYSADEVFVCGSAAEISTVASVDRHVFNGGETGNLTAELQRLYLAAVRSEIVQDWGWTAPVYEGADAGAAITSEAIGVNP